MKRKAGNAKVDDAISWLPIDSRLIFPLFTFGSVRGVAKIFLTLEMILAVGVVLGSVVLLVLYLIPLN